MYMSAFHTFGRRASPALKVPANYSTSSRPLSEISVAIVLKAVAGLLLTVA